MTLAELARGAAARVVALPDDADTASQCQSMGLQIGASVELVRRAPFGGPLHVRTGEVELAVGRELAARVVVEST
ncbi:MAG: ferrous iron transport protein A [Polyangiaceae bacterium]|nr:ferrous iron transport protein A [Polyangiaceae bacterium]